MASQKKSALAKLLAVLVAVILVFGSLVAVLFAYTFYAFRWPYVNVTPTPFEAYPTPSITPSPGTLQPLTPEPPTSTPLAPSTVTPSPTPTVVTLANAISQGFVQATFTGNGHCAGECIQLTIKSQVNYPLDITPPAVGTVLITTSDAQSMVIQQLQGIDHGSTYEAASTIRLNDQTSITYVFRAYCLEFHEANPTTADQFTMSENTNPDVAKILNTAPTLPPSVTSITAMQTAIWVVTDNVSQKDLSKNFPDGVNEVSNVKTILQTAGIDITGKALFAAPTPT